MVTAERIEVKATGLPKKVQGSTSVDRGDIAEISYRKRGWDTRGTRIYDVVAHLWAQDSTVSEIVRTTGYDPVQIRRAREHARERGLLDHPTAEETREARSKAHIDQVSPMKGQNHSFETLLRMAERRRSRQLTFVEAKQISLLATARRVPDRFKKPPFAGLYAGKERRVPAGAWESRAFLETYYAAKLCENFEDKSASRDGKVKPSVRMEDVIHVYEQLNPRVFKRLRRKTLFIDNCVNFLVIQALPPIVREYISIVNQLTVPNISVSEQADLRSRRIQVVRSMSLVDKGELLKFADLAEKRLKTNQPIWQALQYVQTE